MGPDCFLVSWCSAEQVLSLSFEGNMDESILPAPVVSPVLFRCSKLRINAFEVQDDNCRPVTIVDSCSVQDFLDFVAENDQYSK